jgi:hypothetical protein
VIRQKYQADRNARRLYSWRSATALRAPRQLTKRVDVFDPYIHVVMELSPWLTFVSDFQIYPNLFNTFKYNQHNATLHNILYCCQCSTCFRRFFRSSSGAQTVHTTSGVCQACLLPPLAWVSWQCYASGSSQQAWHIPRAVQTVWAPDDGQINRLKRTEHWQ